MKSEEFDELLQSKWMADPTLYAPLRLEDVTFNAITNNSDANGEADVLFEIVWQQKRVPFLGQAKSNATPKSSQRWIEHARDLAAQMSWQAMPAFLTTYLSDGIVAQLEGTGVSGFDLNGNYYVQTADLVAVRLDQANQYPQSREIKKVYSYNSSIIGRFLLRENRRFEQVNEIYEGIQACGGGISLSTVSKVLRALEDELLIEKERGNIRLLQPRKLLGRLRDGYREPRTSDSLKLELPEDRQAKAELLTQALGEAGWMWTGASSAEAYTATAPTTKPTAYVSAESTKMRALREYESARFYNCILQRTDDAFVYFDRNGPWASRIETCLALSQLDKREREIARSIEKQILEGFQIDV